MSYEWPLLIFTLFAQLAVGIFLSVGIARIAFHADGTSKTLTPLIVVTVPILAIGLCASILHLGNPLGAMGAIGNISLSWLSREVLFGALTLIGFAVTALLCAKERKRAAGVSWLISGILSIAFLISMGCAYQMPTIPAWNTPITVLSNFCSAFLMGFSALAAFLAIKNGNAHKNEGEFCLDKTGRDKTITLCAWILPCLFALDCFLQTTLVSTLSQAGSAGVASIALMTQAGSFLVALRFVLGLIGVALLSGVVGLMYSASISENLKKTLPAVSFLFIFAAMFLARMLFYSTAVNLQF